MLFTNDLNVYYSFLCDNYPQLDNLTLLTNPGGGGFESSGSSESGSREISFQYTSNGFTLNCKLALHQQYAAPTIFFQLFTLSTLEDGSECAQLDFSYDTLSKFRDSPMGDDIGDFELTSIAGSHFWFIHPCQYRQLQSENLFWLTLFLSKLNINSCQISPS